MTKIHPEVSQKARETLRKLVIALERMDADDLTLFRELPGTKLLREWINRPAPSQPQHPASEDALKMLRAILDEATRANNTIALNRDGQGQGRITVATAMHRIAQWADAALRQPAAQVSEDALRQGRAALNKANRSIDGLKPRRERLKSALAAKGAADV